jgi:23S rRNA (uridine2552-2'-O)-methyltransferase
MAKKRGSSKAWLKEHRDDVYVQRAQADGYRSRACYKLLELNEKDRFIKPGMTVVDLGSAPGGWSQVAAQLVGHNGRVIASDILTMDPIAGVDFIQGDFTEQLVFDEIRAVIGADQPSVVLSDMAPNMSGIVDVDQPKAMYLVELALDLAVQMLPKGGVFVAKVFHGEGFDEWLKSVRTNFQSVNSRKPSASRPRSKEVYVVAKGFKGQTQLERFSVNP